MTAVQQSMGAWKDATLSFLDHLLVLTVVLGLPALMAGVASHNVLSHGSMDLIPWAFVRLANMLLLLPIIIAAAMRISRSESFFRPTLGEILLEGEHHGRRIWIAAVLLTLLQPISWAIGVVLMWIMLSTTNPLRWLEGGRLLSMRAKWVLLLATTPIWLVGPLGLGFSLGLNVWSIQESTPLMAGTLQVVWALLCTWGWAVVLRLYRVLTAPHP